MKTTRGSDGVGKAKMESLREANLERLAQSALGGHGLASDSFVVTSTGCSVMSQEVKNVNAKLNTKRYFMPEIYGIERRTVRSTAKSLSKDDIQLYYHANLLIRSDGSESKLSQGIPQAYIDSPPHIARIDIARVKHEGLWIVGCSHRIAVCVKADLAIKRIVGARDGVGCRRKVEEVFDASVDLPFLTRWSVIHLQVL